ncbi:MAG: CheR family methyltransferase [Gemmatimonadaceae bacterium]
MTVMLGEPLDEAGFRVLTAKIARERGFACGSYKDRCLRRRIAVRMRAKGVHTYADYVTVLDTDAHEYERLLDVLTINVTRLFRNWDVYDMIGSAVVPELWSLPDERLDVWSAGCASGEEPCSLAALFHRHAEAVGELSRLQRVRILGTDIDRASLETARLASFAETAFGDTPPALRARYFSSMPPHTLLPEARSLVSFEQRDMLRDPAPDGCHLVSCRNVLIYFDRATQETLFQRFHDALRPGGLLVLGKVETLLGRARTLFAPVAARERIFRRL